jgi:hypothetical protein
MPRLPEFEKIVAPSAPDGKCIVVAGPGTSLTIPGIITSEIVMALAEYSRVRRIEVDLGTHPTMGLDRAPSLAAAHEREHRFGIERHRAPRNAPDRSRAFRQWIGPHVNLVIAYAWPGIDNEWIRDYLQAAKSAGVRTVVLCASLPPSRGVRAVSLVSTIRSADRVVVGDVAEANELAAAFGQHGPEVQTHRALSLTGRRRRPGPRQLTAFLPSEGSETLIALLGAFDAIPDAQVKNYNLQLITRYQVGAVKSIVASSYHSSHVQYFGDEMTKDDLRQMCDTSSALSVVDPDPDSRVFSTAINCGIATVVLASSKTAPNVGRGYVGGLMADGLQPASIHVAMNHALRLDELGFPSPNAWGELALGVLDSSMLGEPFRTAPTSGYVGTPSSKRYPELAHFLQRTAETG